MASSSTPDLYNDDGSVNVPADVLANPAVREVFLGTEVTTSLTAPAAGESGVEGQ